VAGTKERLLLVDWPRPLHLVVAGDEQRQEKVTGDRVRTATSRLDVGPATEARPMSCEQCRDRRRATRRPQVAQRGDRVAVVTGVPVTECESCGDVWRGQDVALAVDAMLREMLVTDIVGIRAFPGPHQPRPDRHW
jgi:hypothetical protein